MNYSEFTQRLLDLGFTRVERDDRVLDVFPTEEREKGIELWDKWEDKVIKVIRVRLPYNEKKARMFVLPREEMEKLLLENRQSRLEQYDVVAEGEDIFG